MRSLAKEAGVTSMTVSLALRNNSKISLATRKRIQRLAQKRGYRPDPHVARLMHHLRLHHSKRIQAMICALTDAVRPGRLSWVGKIAQGAREQAAALGFGFDQLCLKEYEGKPGRLQRVLRSRGVEGIILLPMTEPTACDNLVDWKDFSVVSTSHSVTSPELCRVISDQFNNVMLLCRELTRRGHRRIGLEIPEEMERRVRHHYTAALAWHNVYGGTETVAPLLRSTRDEEEIVRWLRKERPDVVITSEPERFEEIKQHPDAGDLPEFAIAMIGYDPVRGLCGIDEQGEELGRAAIDLLAGMIMRGEKGVPQLTRNMLLQGAWVEGAASNKRPRKKSDPVRRKPGRA